ncbi:MAG: hypothetical protein PVF53_18985, partial [Desulfobacterales bacterium]
TGADRGQLVSTMGCSAHRSDALGLTRIQELRNCVHSLNIESYIDKIKTYSILFAINWGDTFND